LFLCFDSKVSQGTTPKPKECNDNNSPIYNLDSTLFKVSLKL